MPRFFLSPSFLYTYALPLISRSSLLLFFFFFFFLCFQVDLKPISIYNLTTEEVSAAMGTSIEGFFNRADLVTEAMASASVAA